MRAGLHEWRRRKQGVYDTADGTRDVTPLNAGRTAFIKPASITVDPTNGDVYVAESR
jgi:hypothetical protein